MTRRPRRLPAVLFAVVALAAGACQGGSPSSDRLARDAPADVLRVGIERPQSLDPAQARSPAELLVAEQLFDGLTTYDPATSEVVPALASGWTSSPDQRNWEFTIRPGATFHNGRAVTSADVRYTLERIARRGSSSPAAAQLDTVTGFRAFSVEDAAEGLAGITTPASEVVKIDLDEPQASLPAVLGHPAFGIVPQEAVDAPEPSFAVRPVGSGPFAIRDRTDDVIHLVPAPGAAVSLQGVDLHLMDDTGASYDAFTDGRLDWTEVPPDRVEQVAERHGRAAFRPYLGQLFYAFNLENPKFADVRFREAIVRAIDRHAIVRVVYGAAARPLDGLVPAGVPGHQDAPCGERCLFDRERARALVQEAFGAEGPPEIGIDFDDTGTQRAVAEAIQASLREAGIPSVLRSYPFADYLRFAVSGGQELFRLGWIAPYPTADAFLAPLFATGRADNVTGFSSERVDELLAAGRAQPDPVLRTAAYQEAERLVLEQLPVLPLAQFEFHSLVSDRVTGLVMSGLGTFDASKVAIAG